MCQLVRGDACCKAERISFRWRRRWSEGAGEIRRSDGRGEVRRPDGRGEVRRLTAAPCSSWGLGVRAEPRPWPDQKTLSAGSWEAAVVAGARHSTASMVAVATATFHPGGSSRNVRIGCALSRQPTN